MQHGIAIYIYMLWPNTRVQVVIKSLNIIIIITSMDDSLDQSPQQLEKNLSEYKEQSKEVRLLGDGSHGMYIFYY